MLARWTACVVVVLAPAAVSAGDFEDGVTAYDRKDYAAAIRHFTAAIAADPTVPAAVFYRGLAHRDRKEYDDALADFTAAIRLEPGPAACYYNRGVVYHLKKDYEKALKDLSEAVRREPKNAIAYAGRGAVYIDAKEYQKAVADLTTAIRLDPKLAAGPNNLAWLRATCPDPKFRDGKSAIELATRACELTAWSAWHELNTLAAAYAEAGDVAAAVKWQTKALAVRTDDKELVEQARARLKGYEGGKPHRLGGP